jgi:hypothetical protein
MNTGRSNHTSVGRALQRAALVIALAGFFVIGSWFNHWSDPRVPWPKGRRLALQTGLAMVREVAADDPLAYASQPAIPPQVEPRAAAARAAVIRRDAEAIQAECRRAAGGDWDQWQRDTEPYRNALKAKVEALKVLHGHAPPELQLEDRVEALEGRDGFPLFETAARKHLNYLYKPESLDEFARDRPVVAANRWLRQKGIDLIFVPVPKMTEVYADHFLDPCPPDGVIAPRVRRTLLDLLNDDVEVVDGLPLFRSMQNAGTEYLYNTADPHWAPCGMRVTAKEIADRIARYTFGARARYALPIVRTMPVPYTPPGGFQAGLTALTADQRKRAELAETMQESGVSMDDDQTPPDDPSSPVLLIGHSYVPGFREQLVKELNLLIATRTSPGGTTEFFADFLRSPECLTSVRVVVWLTTEQHMTHFKPMPEPILQTLGAGKPLGPRPRRARNVSREGRPPVRQIAANAGQNSTPCGGLVLG